MPRAVATGLFVSVCTIKAPSGTFGPSGAPDGSYVTVAGLEAIACMDAPTSIIRITAAEAETMEMSTSEDTEHVLLDTRYPTLEAGWRAGWHAELTGPDGTERVVDIIGVECDSQFQMTRMRVQKFSI